MAFLSRRTSGDRAPVSEAPPTRPMPSSAARKAWLQELTPLVPTQVFRQVYEAAVEGEDDALPTTILRAEVAAPCPSGEVGSPTSDVAMTAAVAARTSQVAASIPQQVPVAIDAVPASIPPVAALTQPHAPLLESDDNPTRYHAVIAPRPQQMRPRRRSRRAAQSLRRHIRRALRGPVAHAIGILIATLLVALMVFLLVRPKPLPSVDPSLGAAVHRRGTR